MSKNKVKKIYPIVREDMASVMYMGKAFFYIPSHVEEIVVFRDNKQFNFRLKK